MDSYLTWLRARVGTDPVILTCAVACVLDEGRLLLQKRPDGRWGLPGGFMDLGESLMETAARETKEETGIDIEIGELLGVYSKYFDEYPSGDRAQVVTAAFVASPAGGVAQADNIESLEVRWVPLGELPPMFNSQHQDVVDDLREGRRNVFR
ncbi:NUDIX domain-containing protein [Nonomuraea sp. NPDC048881]|uniref:NUDIX hydrolase n=1 Tax=unclassified Nonomuraea TaxID=2593643 RepID=UPI0033F3B777